MADRISLSDLVAAIEKGTLTEKEASRYFLSDPARGKPFQPHLKLNPDSVETDLLPASAAAIANALARDLDRSLRPEPGPAKKPFAAKAFTPEGAIRAAEAGATILAEGDSWFDLPFFYPKTLVDHLGDKHAIVTLAQWGDTLDEMMAARDFVKPLRTKAFRHFMFSGGGNDVVGGGRLEDLLRRHDVDHQSPDDAAWYIKDAFIDTLDRVMTHYDSLLAIVRHEAPGTKLVVHGYDYAIPQLNGAWLGAAMEALNLHPHHNAALCKAIIKLMIDAYNARLKAFAAASGGAVIYVDLRKKTRPTEWFDELHARSAAAKRFATAFEQSMGL